MANFQSAFEKLMLLEGEQSNHPKDRGGLTKYGISKTAYPHLDIQNLTQKQAADLYQKDYWRPLALDLEESQAKAELIFQTAVNCGLAATKQFLSMVLPQLEKEESFLLQWKLLVILRYVSITNRNPSQKIFLLGWLNRILKNN